VTLRFSTIGKHHATGAGRIYRNRMYWEARVSDRGKPLGAGRASSTARSAGNVTASLNLNLSDLAATIGRVQLRKLDRIIAGRRRVAAAIAEGLRARSKVVSAGWQPEGAEASYWFMRLHVDASQMTVDANRFAQALGAKASRSAPPTRRDVARAWLVERRVFGARYPWVAGVQGPTGALPCPNALAVWSRT
jgi:dTDP-4-amino-4,6-dideoxygalactose transaminase